ncbi:MAG: TetR/AcrR family transcriptional regulator [Acidobacteriia bacterium]|nr:TetR/AcrR family transcriptional regulator [Terriglobia bacterium]
MGIRARSAERTLDRIYDAAFALFRSRPFSEVTLQAVADAAGVTLQTVLRRCGSKEQLFTDAAARQMELIFRDRDVPSTGGIEAIVRTIVASYEDMGDLNWRGVSQEGEFPLIKKLFDQARVRHRQWIAGCFSEVIGPAEGKERERRITLLFAATDFYLWKLFRLDLGMSRSQTAAHIRDLVTSLAHDFRSEL